MFYDAHFIIDVTNWSRGIWLDGTTQIMDREDILLSDRLVPTYLSEFPDDRCSASEALASMVGMAKIYDRILTLADEHGLRVDEDEFLTLTVSSGGLTIGTMAVSMRRSGAELDVDPFCGEDVSKRPIWNYFVEDLTHDPVIEHSRTPVEAATQWRPAKPLTRSTRFHVYTKPIGQIAVGASRSSVELAPGRFGSLDGSDAVEEAWGEFCGRIREIPDSVIV